MGSGGSEPFDRENVLDMSRPAPGADEDGVGAERRAGTPRIASDPGAHRPREAATLGGVDRLPRIVAPGTRLHLHEHDRGPALHDEVDLAACGAHPSAD